MKALEEDVYLDRSVNTDPDRSGTNTSGNGFIWATTTDSTTVGTSTGILSQTISASDTDTDDTTALYKIDSGQTRRFTLTVNLSANGADGSAAIQLTGINWTIDSTVTAAEWYSSNLNDFKTGLLFLQFI